ncbi:LysE family translocator [Endozoicomonas sp. 8E]|uniref:LysE family translocator n=1 Tax=Endozoicomonas sp. 8E TaxID=3035692 RepID=UPI002938CFCB|nr:LysE family translocator [Endozoicomonas sp. 8E]WOG29828.1 LysE family translocator [Endozoicomonas sp. 8E]
MSIEVWFLYVVSIFVVILIPGPLSLYMVSNSINYGVIRSYPAFLGGTLASSLYLIVSATGLGAILTASENMFLILKLMGALYLVYLGVDTIRKSMADTARKSLNGCSLEFPGFNNLFKKAFLLGASNPKDIIFFMAFLPQFISRDHDLVQQILIIVMTWVVVDLVCKLLYGLLSKSVKPMLNTKKSMSLFERSTGGLYVLAGIAAVLIVK